MTTNEKGDVATLRVELRAREKGIIVSRPTTPAARYDLVLDDAGRLLRVQVKWADCASEDGGVLRVNLGSWERRSGRKMTQKRTYAAGEIDGLVVFVARTGKCYWFDPLLVIGKTELNIRLSCARNGQTKGCLMASSYEW